MTAEEFARLLGGKRTRKGHWIAKCPAHPDSRPSLSIAEGKRQPIVFTCMSQHCEPKAILHAVGLTWRELMGQYTPSPATMRRIQREHDLERAYDRRVFCTVMALGCSQPWAKRWRLWRWWGCTEPFRGWIIDAIARRPLVERYWRGAITRVELDIRSIREEIYPEERRAREFQDRVRREGWDRIWEEYWRKNDERKKCNIAPKPTSARLGRVEEITPCRGGEESERHSGFTVGHRKASVRPPGHGGAPDRGAGAVPIRH